MASTIILPAMHRVITPHRKASTRFQLPFKNGIITPVNDLGASLKVNYVCWCVAVFGHGHRPGLLSYCLINWASLEEVVSKTGNESEGMSTEWSAWPLQPDTDPSVQWPGRLNCLLDWQLLDSSLIAAGSCSYNHQVAVIARFVWVELFCYWRFLSG